MPGHLSSIAVRAPMSLALGVGLLASYGATASLAGAWWEISADALLPMGAGFAPALAAGEWWRVASAAFLHGGLLHLLVNLLVLADIAPTVEASPGTATEGGGPLRGAWRLLGIFLASAAGGFIASAWWNPDAVSVGASGGILGLYGYWLAHAWRRSGTHPDALYWRRRILLAAAYLGAALLAGMLIPGIDNAAHFAGLSVGALLGSMSAWPHRRAGGVVLVVLALNALVALPEDWSIEYLERQAFARRYHEFAARDRAANRAIASLLGDVRAGRELRDVAPEFREQVIGPLEINLQNWANVPDAGAPTSIVAEHVQWRRYATLRLAAAQALLTAMQTRDRAEQAVSLSEFERSMDAARQIVDSVDRGSGAREPIGGSAPGSGIQ